MSTPRRTLAAFTVALVAFSPALAMAKDLCISGPIGEFMVLRNFKMPKAGSCGPIAGNSPTGTFIASGSACATSDGTKLEMHWLGRNDNDDSIEALLFLSLPDMNVGHVDSKANWAFSSVTTSGISASFCKGEVVP